MGWVQNSFRVTVSSGSTALQDPSYHDTYLLTVEPKDEKLATGAAGVVGDADHQCGSAGWSCWRFTLDGKARRELGYAPRPIGGALEEMVQSILSKSQESTNRDIIDVRAYSSLPDES
jgi:hypothetical protein